MPRNRNPEEERPRCGKLLKTGRRCTHPLGHTYNCAAKRSQREWFAERRVQWRTYLDEYKTARGCAMCGFQSERGGYFDLDHLDRSAGRNTSVTVMCRHLNPEREDHLQRVLDEMAKCQVLCVACHRDKTSEDLAGDWPDAAYNPAVKGCPGTEGMKRQVAALQETWTTNLRTHRAAGSGRSTWGNSSVSWGYSRSFSC